MKKGISLLSLIITIIVLLILLSVAVFRGNDIYEDAQLAVAYNNISTVQEVVTLKMMNNMSKYSIDENKILNVYKWEGVVQGFIPNDVEPDFANSIVKINGLIPVLQVSDDIAKSLSIGIDEIRKYFVDAKGVVYYYNNGKGFLAEDGIRHYNGTLIVDSSVKVVIPEVLIPEIWEEEKLNETNPVVIKGSVIAPIPKDYTPSILEEDEGIVIYEGTEPFDESDEDENGIIDDKETRNQFVWIPIDDINEIVYCVQTNNITNDCNIGIENGKVKCMVHNSHQIIGRRRGYKNVSLLFKL